MNVFISIIEEAYVSSKMHNRNHWVYSYLKIDPNYVSLDEKGQEDQSKSKDQRKLMKEVYSKNVLREIVSKPSIEESFKSSIGPNKQNKLDVEKNLDQCFQTVLYYDLL